MIYFKKSETAVTSPTGADGGRSRYTLTRTAWPTRNSSICKTSINPCFHFKDSKA